MTTIPEDAPEIPRNDPADLERHVEKGLRRYRTNLDPVLLRFEFTKMRHTASLVLFTTCTTCGAVFVVGGEDTSKHLYKHWATHHRLRYARALVTARLAARRATTSSRSER